VLALVEVPEHGDAVLSARGGEGTVGGDGEGVDVPGVAEVVGLQLALVKLPDLMSALRNCTIDSKSKRRVLEIRDLGDIVGLIGQAL
jgi:hypothetical protein